MTRIVPEDLRDLVVPTSVGLGHSYPSYFSSLSLLLSQHLCWHRWISQSVELDLVPEGTVEIDKPSFLGWMGPSSFI